MCASERIASCDLLVAVRRRGIRAARDLLFFSGLAGYILANRFMKRAGQKATSQRPANGIVGLRLNGLVISGLLCLCVPGRAATNGLVAYSVRIWQTDEGLPQNSVHALAQTAEGYLWVGTHEGLARFDGARFVPVEERAAPELKHGWITALCVGRDGSLWIGC